jgi:NitT/TauT family transport system substrate-binding protein
MEKRFLFSLLASVIIFTLALAACTPAGQPPAAPAETASLKIALLPVVDALPMYVAQKEGLFEKHGVKVEFVPVASAPERDQLIAAGQADGMINEALSTALYNKNKTQVQTVRFARAATADTPLFSILASGKSGITSAEGLKGVEIGISQGTVIEYLTDRLLQASGLATGEIKTVAVPKIPDRLNLLNTGELKAATLPEPATSLAVQQGSKVILDDTLRPEYSFSTISFRKPVIDQNAQAVRSFLAAIEEATDRINADPSKYAPLLVEQKILPPPLANTFKVPAFVKAGVPSEAQWKDMLAWAKENGILKQDVSYSESVNSSLLP